MRGGLRIGRILGIDLLLDPSWILIFAFMTWSLAAMFSRLHPSWSPGLPLAVGVLAVVLFFASVVLHELAHSVVALASGLRVRRITLFFFGGISSIEEEPKSPGTEALMALAGPLVSITVGFWLSVLAAAVVGFTRGDVDDPQTAIVRLGPLAALLAWLGPVNVLVGLFNLIPAFPLDGGRVLRAILWKTTGSVRRATSWASATGQAFAWLFIVAGVAIAFGAELPFFGTGMASGLWLVLIGWFLNGAAKSSQERLVVEEALDGVTVERVMRRGTPEVTSDLPVGELVGSFFMGSEARAFPVVDRGEMVGLVCLSDVRNAPRENWNGLRVGNVMTQMEKLAWVSPEARAFDALEIMLNRGVSQVPVLVGTNFLGMVELRDLARWLEMTRRGGTPTRPSWAT